MRAVKTRERSVREAIGSIKAGIAGAGLLVLSIAGCLPAAAAAAKPFLTCSFSSLGEDRQLSFHAAADPYQAPLVSINDHFMFRAVIVGDGNRLLYVKLHTYYPLGDKRILLHQARYLSPVVGDGADPAALTGEQRVYSPDLERELIYRCALREERS
jgi:hypothetical protein